MRIYLLLLLFLTLPAVARTPEEVVRKVYQTHLDNKSLKDTVRLCESCFTPGFLGIMERALANPPGGKKPFVDFDFFVNSQAGYVKFELGKATVSGKEATVPIRIWNDSRGYKFEQDPEKREKMADSAQIHLVDVGHGFQIKDIEFTARKTVSPDGEVFESPARSMRQVLKEIAEGR